MPKIPSANPLKAFSGTASLPALTAENTKPAGIAARFVGMVKVSDDIAVSNIAATGSISVKRNINVVGEAHVGTLFAKENVILGSDCAEDFDIAASADIEPGTVMVLNDEGALRASHLPYDRRVAGVISGAGDYAPGLILGRSHSVLKRQPLALVGKVYCKADAQYAPIEVGDLLTSSSTPGHAMRAEEPLRAFGAVIGKALRPLKSGKGLIPILIALQ